jgi:hypothetical protein
MEQEVNTADAILQRYGALFPEGRENPYVYEVTTGAFGDEGQAPGDYWQQEVERTLQVFQLSRHVLGMIMEHQEFEMPNIRPEAEHSDNFTRLLLWKGQQILLSMFDIRNDTNYHVAHVARYPLQPSVIWSLGPLIEVDRRHRVEHPETE